MDFLDFLVRKSAVEKEDQKIRFLDKLTLERIDTIPLNDIDMLQLGGTTKMKNVADIMITSLDEIRAYTLAGVPRFILSELSEATISNTQGNDPITGKGGRRLSSLKRNKAMKISGTNGIVSAGLLEAQTGGTFVHKESTPVSWTEYLTVNSNKATLEYKAIGAVGDEIEALYIRNKDGSCGDKLEQATTSASGKFAYNSTSKELTFTGVADGTEIVVFYTRNIAGDVLANESDVYSEVLRLYVDATGEDLCHNLYHVQICIPKADFSGDFDLAMGDNQTTHAFEAESLPSSCGSAGNLWNYTVFGVNEKDAG